MILGIGNDVVEKARIEKLHEEFGERFEERLFTPKELEIAESRGVHRLSSLARRFAAKEAAVKALGTGMRHGISWQDIEVLSGEDNAPVLHLHGEASKRLKLIVPQGKFARLHVALSDSDEMAWAVVMIEAVDNA